MKTEFEATDIEKLAQEITLRVTESLKSGLVPATHTEDTIFTAETLASYLVTTPKWVYNHLAGLPHFKIDGLLRFRKRVIDKFFEQHPSKLPLSRDIR